MQTLILLALIVIVCLRNKSVKSYHEAYPACPGRTCHQVRPVQKPHITRFDNVSANVMIKLMPSRNTVKIFVDNSYYHIYNRGVNKTDIFCEDQDYRVFLHYLKIFLFPKDDPRYEDEVADQVRPLKRSNLDKQIDLIAYCLMPNHFHLLIFQKDKTAMTQIIRKVSNAYVRYFNEKNERVGSLFQGCYKALKVETEEQLLHLTRYIHSNPAKGAVPSEVVSKIRNYPYSSYTAYISNIKPKWLKPEVILAFFRSGKSLQTKDMLSYQSFVESFDEETTIAYIAGLTLE